MDNESFITHCIEAVASRERVPLNEVFVTWQSKVLQNKKALLGTTRRESAYYECTYNGDKKELYIDKYNKQSNEVIDMKPKRKFTRVISKPRGAGKTYELIKDAAEHNSVILVRWSAMAKEIKARAAAMGVKIKEPITINQLIDGKTKGVRNETYSVDNAELILADLLKQYGVSKLNAITVTPLETEEDLYFSHS